MKNITLDGYEYILIYRQPTTMNVLCVYKIQKIQGANENPVYFLASSELREQCIRGNTFNKMKTYIMPQHYEGFFKDEFTAILMAKYVAACSYIDLQEVALEDAQKALAEVTKKLVNLQSCISFKNCDVYDQYYDSQNELRKVAVNRERGETNERSKD